MKITKIICISVTMVILLCSCGNVNNKTSMAGNSSEIDTFTNDTSATSSEGISPNATKEYDKIAIDFLTKLKNSDSKALSDITDTRCDGVFDFLSDVKIDDFSFELNEELFGKDDNGNESSKGYSYNVILKILKSKSNIFPVGENEWILIIEPSASSCIAYFNPKDSNLKILTNSMQHNYIALCYLFSNKFNCFSSLTEFNEIVPSVDNEVKYNSFIYQSIEFYIANTGSYDLSVEKLSAYFNNSLGINSIDFKKYKYYDPQTETFSPPYHGSRWNFYTLVSDEYNATNNQRTVVLDYYADSAMLVKAKTMKYVIEGSSDEDFKLLSTELIYDSGFSPGYGSV